MDNLVSLLLNKKSKPVFADKPNPKKYRFFLAGPQQKDLWRGELLDGGGMHMQEWVLHPYNMSEMIWLGSYFGEWQEDKAYGVVEITSSEASELTGGNHEDQF